MGFARISTAGISTAMVAIALFAAPAKAGFDDFISEAGDANPPTHVSDTNSLVEDSEAMHLLFDLSSEPTSDEIRSMCSPPVVDSRPASVAVTAPLPPA